MKRQKRDERRSLRPEPEPALSLAQPESKGLADPEPESLGDFSLPSPLPRTGDLSAAEEGPGVRDLALRLS